MHLLNNYHGEDSLILVRSIFENYLSSIHVVNHPKEIHDKIIARVGLLSGAFSYKRNSKGNPIYSKAIDNKTKEEVDISFSFSEMAKRSLYPEDYIIYERQYSRLSSYVHPDFLKVTDYMEADSIPAYKEEWYLEVPLLSIYFTVLILDCFYSLIIATKQIQGDIRRIVRRIVNKYMRLFMEYEKNENMNDDMLSIRNCLQKLSVLKQQNGTALLVQATPGNM